MSKVTARSLSDRVVSLLIGGRLHRLMVPEERDYAAAWRMQPKWVVSRSLKSVGPNAALVGDDLEAARGGLKAQFAGEIEVGGPWRRASPISV